MRPPIFILCADGELLAYSDPERALRYVESPDVEGGEYPTVFDADGLRLKLEPIEPTKTRKRWFITSITLTPVALRALEAQPTGADELRVLLLERFPDADPGIGLQDLVQRAVSALPSP